MNASPIVALCLAAALAVSYPSDAGAFNDVTAAPGGVAAGGDITGTVNVGLSPEQVKELTEAAARGATGPLTAAIVDLSTKLGVTEDATRSLLRIVGEQDVPLERLSETLVRVANDYKRRSASFGASYGFRLTQPKGKLHERRRQMRAVTSEPVSEVKIPLLAGNLQGISSNLGLAGRRWPKI